MSFRTILKRAARGAIKAAGGIEAAALACELSASQAGRWHNLNDVDLPGWDHAFRLDEDAVIEGRRPELLAGYARALNHVVVPLPETHGGEDALGSAMIDASAEFGDVANALRDATRDGRVDRAEGQEIARQCEEAIEALVRIKTLAVKEIAPSEQGDAA